MNRVKELKLIGRFVHINRHDSINKTILEDKVEGKRGRGRLRIRWEQDFGDWPEEDIVGAGRRRETLRGIGDS